LLVLKTKDAEHERMDLLAQTLSPGDVSTAAERIRPYIRRTPLLDLEIDARRVLLKLEHLQRSGSFKLRGALNALLSAPSGHHVVAASGGNHGLAVATAASLLRVPATVHVPETVPAAKARRIEATGARLVKQGANFAEAAVIAREAATAPDRLFVHPYDDPAVVAGQGTVGAEVVADAPEADVLAVAVGGGGLAAGIALSVGERRLVGVEPEGCRCLYDALAAGEPVDSPVDSVAASATGASRVGAVPFGVLTEHGALSVLVSDEQILDARDLLWEECRIAVEPAAALPLAAWRAGLVPGDLPCLVICGANADWRAA
jgi:threonine dehydratase